MQVLPFNSAYKKQSTDIEPSERINLVPILNPKGIRTKKAYYLRPGLSLFAEQSGASVVRGALANADENEGYVVIGNKLYEVSTGGTLTERDTLATSTGRVYMALGVDSLMTTDGSNGYKFVPSTNTATDITDLDFPGAATVTYLQTHFLFNQPNTGKMYQSNFDDPGDIDALDFATAESQPDNIVAVVAADENLYLAGKKTLEIWYATTEDFPWSKREYVEVGCLAAGSVVRFTYQTDDGENIGAMVMLGTTNEGGVHVYLIVNYSAINISADIDDILESYTTLSDIFCFTFREKGQTFLVMTSPTHNDTFVYCFEAKEWCEWQDSNGDRFVANCYMRLNGKHIVGARNSGKLFELTFGTLNDNGTNFNWSLTFPVGTDTRERKRITRFQIDMQTGTGTGGGNNPTISLAVSRNGGNTYQTARSRSIGEQNQYLTRVFWNRITNCYSPVLKLSGASGNNLRLFNPHIEVTIEGR